MTVPLAAAAVRALNVWVRTCGGSATSFLPLLYAIIDRGDAFNFGTALPQNILSRTETSFG
jgi:hypothetical protein